MSSIEPTRDEAVGRFGVFEVDIKSGEIRKHGVRLKLTKQPFQILTVLLERPGEVVTREELRLRLWPENYYTDFDHGLNKGINRLREVLSDDRISPRFVETVPQKGYRFIAPITWVSEPRVEIGASDPSAEEVVPQHASQRTPIWLQKSLLPIVLSLAVGVALGWMWRSATHKPPMQHTLRVQLELPAEAHLVTEGDLAGGLVLSPDESSVVFSATTSSGQTMLWAQKLSDSAAVPIAGTEGALFPFWSPDSKFVGFFTPSKLKRLDIATRTLRTLCDIKNPRGGDWNRENVIIFAANNFGGISRVSADGGAPTAVTSTASSNFTTHRWPSFLPDGKRFVFVAANHDPKKSVRPEIMLASVSNPTPRHVVYADANAQYVDGKLLFVVGHSLFQQEFDLKSSILKQSASLISDDVENNGTAWHASFSARHNLLLFQDQASPASAQTRVEWRDQNGKLLDATDFGSFHGIVVEKAGTFLVETGDPDWEISLMDGGKRLIRLTKDPVSQNPVPSPDGETVAFTSHRSPEFSIRFLRTDGSGDYASSFPSAGALPMSWSQDGKRLMYLQYPHELRWFDFMTRTSTKYLDSLGIVTDARFSPDGNWVAYANDETGQTEVYVASFPDRARRYRVTRAGGGVPRWSHDGRALHFITADGTIYRASIAEGRRELVIGEPHALFLTNADRSNWFAPRYDVDPTGNMFVIVARHLDSQPKITVLTNWQFR